MTQRARRAYMYPLLHLLKRIVQKSLHESALYHHRSDTNNMPSHLSFYLSSYLYSYIINNPAVYPPLQLYGLQLTFLVISLIIHLSYNFANQIIHIIFLLTSFIIKIARAAFLADFLPVFLNFSIAW